jgi:hypothetical protein
MTGPLPPKYLCTQVCVLPATPYCAHKCVCHPLLLTAPLPWVCPPLSLQAGSGVKAQGVPPRTTQPAPLAGLHTCHALQTPFHAALPSQLSVINTAGL